MQAITVAKGDGIGSGILKSQLFDGEFKSGDALELINRMIQTKIKFHEDQIRFDCTEEDIKYRESHIKQLQNEWHRLRTDIQEKKDDGKMDATINFY